MMLAYKTVSKCADGKSRGENVNIFLSKSTQSVLGRGF